jgi:hypothetical protein
VKSEPGKAPSKQTHNDDRMIFTATGHSWKMRACLWYIGWSKNTKVI